MKRYSHLVYRSMMWKNNRSASADTVFSNDRISVDMAIAQATVKKDQLANGCSSYENVAKESKSDCMPLVSSLKTMLVGAVCDIKDSPYRIFKVSLIV